MIYKGFRLKQLASWELALHSPTAVVEWDRQLFTLKHAVPASRGPIETELWSKCWSTSGVLFLGSLLMTFDALPLTWLLVAENKTYRFISKVLQVPYPGTYLLRNYRTIHTLQCMVVEQHSYRYLGIYSIGTGYLYYGFVFMDFGFQQKSR